MPTRPGINCQSSHSVSIIRSIYFIIPQALTLGNGKVLSMAGATELNAKMRALGFEVYDPDMSMFTLGGGGVRPSIHIIMKQAQ